MHRALGLNAVDFLLGLIKGILGSCFQALRCHCHHARFLICAVRVTASIRFWVINATYALLRISRHYGFLTLVKCSGGQTALAPREPLYIRHLRLMASNDPLNAVEGKRYLYHGSPFISDIVTFVLLSFLFSTKLSYASIVTLSSFIWPGWTCLYYFGNISPVTYGHLTQRLVSYFVTAQVRRK